MKLPTEDVYFVYVYYIDDIESYVGKGIKIRDQQHLWEARRIIDRRKRGELVRTTHWYNALAQAILDNRSIRCRRVAEGLTSPEAFDLERKLIAMYGRVGANDGLLFNTHEGGKGMSSEDAIKLNADSAARAKRVAAAKKYWSQPAARANWRERMTPYWENSKLKTAAKKAEAKAMNATRPKSKRSYESQTRIWTSESKSKLRETFAKPEIKIKRWANRRKKLLDRFRNLGIGDCLDK